VLLEKTCDVDRGAGFVVMEPTGGAHVVTAEAFDLHQNSIWTPG
jgi:hypothetical protein